MQLEIRDRRPDRRREVAVGDALDGVPNAADAAADQRRQTQRQQQDRDDPHRRDDDVAEKQRGQAADCHRGGNADAEEPGTAADDGVPVEAGHAIGAHHDSPPWDILRRRRGTQRLADVEIRVAAACEHGAGGVGQRDHRSFRQRNARNSVCISVVVAGRQGADHVAWCWRRGYAGTVVGATSAGSARDKLPRGRTACIGLCAGGSTSARTASQCLHDSASVSRMLSSSGWPRRTPANSRSLFARSNVITAG